METLLLAEIIGFAAGIFIAVNLLPQIFKSWKTKQVEDLSLCMIITVLIGEALWLVYGIMLMSPPIIFSDGLGTITSMVLFGIKLKYDKK